MSKRLYAITAIAFGKYMILNSWKRDYEFKNRHLMVFESPLGKRIAVPVSEKYDGFYDSLSRVLSTLELYLGKDKDEIIKEITTSYYDRLEFRLKSNATMDGKLPLGYAASCMEGIKDLILYSACAEQIVEPVCLRASNSSQRIVNKFKLEQTEVGSFIINIDTKVIVEDNEQITLQNCLVNAPIEHKVVERIYNAITQINDIVEDKTSVNRIIEDAYQTGITANMCDALMKLKLDDIEIDTTIRYASAITKEPNSSYKIAISEKHFYVIYEISKRYREREQYKDITLRGIVQMMKKDKSKKSGKQWITLIVFIDEKLKSVHILLSDADYKLANQAHMNDSQIEVSGELDMTNPRKWLLNAARDLKIV